MLSKVQTETAVTVRRPIRFARVVSAVVVFLTSALPARAEPENCGETQIPIERLVSNLESRVRADPNDGKALLNLARTHAMAFARKRPTQLACHGSWGSWELVSEGGNPNVQPDVSPAANREQQRVADAHLREAVRNYERAVVLMPREPFAAFTWLGYAWTLQQSGRMKEAVAAYRETVALAWPADRERNEHRFNADGTVAFFAMATPPGWRFVTEEAARFLIPLLDAKQDAAEIATLREHVAFIGKRR